MVFGAIASAIGSVAGSIFDRNNAKDDAKKAWERNLYTQDKAFQHDIEMWNKQNEYNTPLAQMERYKAAGLNPNLIYTQGSSGNATSAPSMHMANAEKPTHTSLQFDKLMPLFQMRNLESQNQLINAQTVAAQEDAKNKALANVRYGIENQYLPDQLQANINKTKKETEVAGRNNSPLNRVVNAFMDDYGIMGGIIPRVYRDEPSVVKKNKKNSSDWDWFGK